MFYCKYRDVFLPISRICESVLFLLPLRFPSPGTPEEKPHWISAGPRRVRHAAAGEGPGWQRTGNVSTDDDVC